MLVRFGFFLLVVPLLLVGVACGGGDDDDDDNGGGGGNVGGNGGNNSGGSGSGSNDGTITVDGDEYSVQLTDCNTQQGGQNVFGWNGTIDGKAANVFGGAGINGTGTIGFDLDGTTFLIAGAMVDIDGDTISFDGQAVNSATGKTLNVSFELDCD